MLRKAQFPSVASGGALRLLLAKADLIAEAGNAVCLSSSLCFVDHIWLWKAVPCRWPSASTSVHHDISNQAEVVLLVCRGSPRPGARAARSVSRWERLSCLSVVSITALSDQSQQHAAG